MKRTFKYLFPALLLFSVSAGAQGIRIMPGTTFKVVDAPYTMVLADGFHFENNTAVNGNLTLKATGSGSSEIKGSGTLLLNQVQMNKAAGQQLLLQKNIGVADDVVFTSGLLNLNGYDVVLADTAALVNESEASRVVGLGGAVQVTYNLDAPLAENPANLGLIITSGANWGSTVIRRSPAVYTSSGGGSSIRRSYQLAPANNTGLNAFLRMYYFDAELNSLNESTLDFFRSDNNGGSWTNIGAAGRNTTQNFVNVNGIQTMSLFTLSTTNNPLPLQLREFNATCLYNKATLQWRMDNPATVAYFRIDKSKDGSAWENIADRITVQPAAHVYTYSDMADAYPYYRLQVVEPDGAVSYSPVQPVDCGTASYHFRLLQNPVAEQIRIAVQAKAALEVSVFVYDLEGRILQQRITHLDAGDSRLNIEAAGMAKGMYLVQVKHRQETLWQTKFVK